ncbi:MAG: flagellin, partial [Deltaproteobacteria bacterium]|nr:flagellin [Deltaproteobacteria bacterium]
MGLRINTNVAALTAHRYLTITDKSLQKSLERLSSGYRINHASDDAAGLAIANRFRASIRSLYVAQRNITEATSVVQVAEGAATQIEGILERLKELATQAASDNVSDTDRSKLNAEAQKLIDEINRIADGTRYQGTTLINGHYGDYVSTMTSSVNGTMTVLLNGAETGTYTITEAGNSITITNGSITENVSVSSAGDQVVTFEALGLKLQLSSDYDLNDLDGSTFTVTSGSGGIFQVGDKNDSSTDQITSVDLGDLNANAIGGATIDSTVQYVSDILLTSRTNAQNAMTILDAAIDDISTVLGNMGAYMSRLSYASGSVAVTIENYSASESVIRDVDMAFEMTTFTKNQILLQAGTAMLAQANMA